MKNITKILIVEDESIVAIDLKFILNKLNYEVIAICRTGEDAINTIRDHEPDLILMDIMLAGKLNGIETAEQIKKIRNIPVIYVTAYADFNTLHNAKITEPFGYILKPFDEKTLLSTIEMALYKYSMERRLKESEERYRLLVEHSPVAIGILADRKVAYANASAAKIFGSGKPEDVINKPILDFVHPDFLNLVNKRLRKVILDGNSFDAFDEKFVCLDGKTIDAEFAVIPIIYQGKRAAQIVIRDITELKKKEKVQQITLKILQLADVTDSLEDLYDNIYKIISDYLPINNFFIAIYDDKTNRISYPYYKDKYNPKPFERIYSNGLIEYSIEVGKSVLLYDDDIREIEKDGNYKFYGKPVKKWMGVPLRIREKVIGALVFKEYFDENVLDENEKELLELISFPISRAIERKMLEEERNQYTENLKELNEAKDKLFSIISHDLRSPFDSILGFTDLLKNEYEDLTKDEIHLYIESLYQSSRHIYSLLNNLLQYSRFQLGKMDFEPKKIQLHKVVNKNLQALKGIAVKKQIELKENVEEDITVFADEDMLNSILLNLATNAIKFTDFNGKIAINAFKENGIVKISVQDDGIGMDEKIRDNLFNLNSKSQPGTANELGTGLGLLLTKEFIEKNNGKISVDSKKGEGTTIQFSLPSASF